MDAQQRTILKSGLRLMKNWEGQEWERWNGRLRDDLIAWQEKDGPAKGSWTPRDRSEYSQAGGRLLTTCLAALTLEVYYRYKPIMSDVAAASLASKSLTTDSATTAAPNPETAPPQSDGPSVQ